MYEERDVKDTLSFLRGFIPKLLATLFREATKADKPA